MSVTPNIRSTNILIGNHIRRYRSALFTNEEFFLSDFEETYRQMAPSLHSKLASDQPDFDALNYVATRLPPCIYQVKRIILTASIDNFREAGYSVTQWQKVSALNRRRLYYWDASTRVLAGIINSDSDLDDLVNNLLAYGIEHRKIGQISINLTLGQIDLLKEIFSSDYQEFIASTNSVFNPSLQLLPFPPVQYSENYQKWWLNTVNRSLILGLSQKPIYFISSNSHNLVNIIGGFLNYRQTFIFDYISHTQPTLYQQWFESKRKNNLSQVNDFLYYLANNFLQNNPQFLAEKNEYEKSLGIITVKSDDCFPGDVQFIPLNSITKSLHLDPNLKINDPKKISESQAYIINIQYPLGLAAYYLLKNILNYFSGLKGIYIFGKAAILNGSIGDIQIPRIVFDEVSGNTFEIDNLFSSYFPYQTYISNLLQNLKAVCVYGTLLENRPQLENYIATNQNIIEMENGSYLSAIVEKFMNQNQAVSQSQTFHLTNLPLDLGIINYASDNPLNQNLGQENLAFRNIESSYLSVITALQRIIDLENS